MVEKLWPKDHNVYMKVQHGITFDPQLQIESLFLQNAPCDQEIPNQPLPCMKEAHMIIIAHMCKMEGNLIIQIWLMLPTKYDFHDVY